MKNQVNQKEEWEIPLSFGGGSGEAYEPQTI